MTDYTDDFGLSAMEKDWNENETVAIGSYVESPDTDTDVEAEEAA